MIDHKKSWAEQFLRIGLQQRWKETSGKHSGKGWKDRKIFDQMFSYSRLYNSAGSNSCRPVLVHPIFMSIILEHYKQLDKMWKRASNNL